MQKGTVVWFTGLPNAGKTSVSRAVFHRLQSMGYAVELIDSDEAPRSLTKDLSEDWLTRQRQKCTNLTYIAKLLYKHNVIVLLASVGRLEEMRAIARREIPDFIEVYLKCPLDVRIQRDDKEKYVRHASTIHFYEEPSEPELLIETDKSPLEQSAERIIRYLTESGYITGRTEQKPSS